MKKLLSALLVSLALVAPAAAQTINNLGAGAAVSGTDMLPAYQGANPAKRVTVDQIKTYTGKSAVRATTTTSEALADSDQNKLVTFSNAGAVACTIAQAGAGGNFLAGWAVSLKNLGAGTVTCTPTTSTIDGVTPLTLTTGQGVDLYSDGTNYFTQPGKGSGGTPGGSSGQIQYNNGGAFGGFTMANDCTFSQPNIRCNMPNSGIVSNRWYQAFRGEVQGFGGSGVANQIACYFAVVPRLVTIKTLGFYNNVAGSTNVQMAIYANDTTTGRPAALIGNTGSVSNGTTGTHSGAMAANKQVGPGGADGGREVWFCSNMNDSTATYGTVTNTNSSQAAVIGSATLGEVLVANDHIVGVVCSGANCNGGSSTFGTWPASLAGSTWTTESSGTTGIYSPNIAYQAN